MLTHPIDVDFQRYDLVRSRRVTTVLQFGVGFSASLLVDVL